jgi:hypothetical protein
MGTNDPAKILRGLNLSLSTRDIERAEQMLREQKSASIPPSNAKSELRRALLNCIRAIDSGDSDLPQLMTDLRRRLGGEPVDEVSSHNQQYETHGCFTMFRPERKPSPKPW